MGTNEEGRKGISDGFIGTIYYGSSSNPGFS
jgi:hypothetical protein